MTDTTTLSPDQAAAVAAATKAGVTINGQPAVAPVAPATTSTTSTVPARPENVPEKFWDAEKGSVNTDAILKSYAELEKKTSAAPAAKPATTEPGTAPTAAAKDVLKVAANALIANGKLTDAERAQLEQVGLDEATVNAHVSALQTKANEIVQSAYKVTGGEEGYKVMLAWARASLDANEVALFDQQVHDGQSALSAVRGLYARFQMEADKDGALNIGTGGTASADVYRSPAEIKAAMADPKYKVDAAYRKDVGDKLLRSKKAGTIGFGR